MKRILAFLMALLFVSSPANAFALTDTKILTDPVQNTYVGRVEAKDIAHTLNFKDVPVSHWAREAIARTGALNLTKGYDTTFRPSGTVTKEEALAFIVRAMGLEPAAQQAAIALNTTAPEKSPLRTLWSYGYLNQANATGLLTPQQYTESIADPPEVDPDAFRRGDPATREEVADWIVKAINYISPGSFTSSATQQKIYTFSDWSTIDETCVKSVELVTANNIMVGSNGKFKPKGSITRAEMAQILKNMDSIYNQAVGIDKKTGTVGAIRDIQFSKTGSATLWRNLYIRTEDGNIDLMIYQLDKSTSPQAKDRDAVVYKDGAIGGLSLLKEGDKVEYLVDKVSADRTDGLANTISNTDLNTAANVPENLAAAISSTTTNRAVLYVQVTSGIEIKTVQGKLNMIDYANGEIHIVDAYNKRFMYKMIDGLHGTDATGNYVTIDQKNRYAKDVPSGGNVILTLKNNVVDEIQYVGEPTLISEIRGIVIENNPGLGYLTIVDNNGKEVTKNYYENEITVEKQQHYDDMDEIGYLDEVFPNFEYDPRDTLISDVEPGDIVFIRTKPDDNNVIASISAATNYTMRYGKILEFKKDEALAHMLIEFEDKQTAWFDVADTVFVSKDGKPIAFSDVKVGDWTRLLVNTAIISPGYVIETVKEFTIEGGQHLISNIVKGQLSNIDVMQKKLILQNAQTYGKTSWGAYQEIQSFPLGGSDTAFYYNGKRVPLDYVNKYLKRSEGDVYVALESSAAGERVAMVTFRNSSDVYLSPDVILSSTGTGTFSVQGFGGTIATDAGTIVRINGRLVTGNAITPSTYGTVVLNGGAQAAIVDIYERPATSGLMFFRGRITSVDEGKKFVMNPIAQLYGDEWQYSPLERTFTIDYTTKYSDTTGDLGINAFVGYGTNSATNKSYSYTVVSDGAKANYIMRSVYPDDEIRGVVVSASGATIGLKSAQYRDKKTGAWKPISTVNTAATVTLQTNGVIVQDNQVVDISKMKLGSTVKVMTNNLQITATTQNPTVSGYIVFVEK